MWQRPMAYFTDNRRARNPIAAKHRWKVGTASAVGLFSLAMLAGCGEPVDQTTAKPAGPAAPSDKPSATATKSPSTKTASTEASAKRSRHQAKKHHSTASASTQTSSSKSGPKKTSGSRKHDTAEKVRSHEKSSTGAVLLRSGANGDQVRELQARLKQLHWFDHAVTDSYGPATTNAVKGFQRKRELPATGKVDTKTWKRLKGMTNEPTRSELANHRAEKREQSTGDNKTEGAKTEKATDQKQPENNRSPGKPLMQTGDSTNRVRALQARLKQRHWFDADVTGYYGPVTAKAVTEFQHKRRLPATGKVDTATWRSLVGHTEKPSKSDLKSTEDKNKSSKSTATGAGKKVRTKNLDDRCLSGRAICIDKTTKKLTWVIDGKPQLSFDVRFGAVSTPTRDGAFTVLRKNRHWVSDLYDSKMPYSMFFSGGQAVHYSSDFAARGYNGASHGCVNVRDRSGIETVFHQAKIGDKVIVYRS